MTASHTLPRTLASSFMSSILLPLTLLLLLSLLSGHYTHKVVRKGKSFLSRLVLAIPPLLFFFLSPFLFDRDTQPFWRYATSGILSWWSAHKLLLLTLGRGTLATSAKTSLQTTLQLLIPAAFVDRRTALRHGLVMEAAGWPVLLLQFLAKGGFSLSLAVVIAWLKVIESGVVTTPKPPSLLLPLLPLLARFPRASSLLQHFFFSFVVYSTFSLVMDLPVALLRLFRADLGDVTMLPQLDFPLASTSLREFWNRRWNISAGSILRQLVYQPFLDLARGKPVSRVGREEEEYRREESVARPTTAISSQQPAGEVSSSSSAAAAAAAADGAPVPSALRSRAGRPAKEEDALAPLTTAATPAAPRSPSSLRITVARATAVLLTFAASGLCHEMIMWHCSGMKGVTGRMLGFFTLNGVGCVVEDLWRKWREGRREGPHGHGVLASTSSSYPRTPSFPRIRAFLVILLLQTLAEIFWWKPFVDTDLDTRMLSEWMGWLGAGGWMGGIGGVLPPAIPVGGKR